MNRGCIPVMLIGALAVPFFASAEIVITRVTYDPPGADTGHEWVELLNTGTSSVRLTDLRLRVGGANHKIVALSGDGMLGVQGHAAIVQDPALFAQESPSFVGSVFRASFSLTNKSGTVDIIDKSGAVVATKSYQAPPPAPVPPKPAHTASKSAKNSKSRTFRKTPDLPTTSDQGADISSVADAPQAAAASEAGSGSSPLWWMGAIALAGVAGVATFASRHVAKREWDIVEEKPEDM